MPFGSNPKQHKPILDKDGDLVILRSGKLALRAVKGLPEAPPPPWYAEYLMEEWKRKSGVDQKPIDTRTGCERSLEEWQQSERVRASHEFIGSTGGPRHAIWVEGVKA